MSVYSTPSIGKSDPDFSIAHGSRHGNESTKSVSLSLSRNCNTYRRKRRRGRKKKIYLKNGELRDIIIEVYSKVRNIIIEIDGVKKCER